MLIETLSVGPFALNAYIVADPARGEAALIDPGDDVDRLELRARELGVRPRVILCTHAHLAHTAHAREAARRFDAKVHLHAADRFLLARLPEQAVVFGLPPTAPPEIDHEIVHGDRIRVGAIDIDVVHTPGHSPGSVCYWVESSAVVFTGDVLFQGSVGRTDVPGGSQDELIESIRERLFPLGDEVSVRPGHGPATALGVERSDNPFVNGQLLG